MNFSELTQDSALARSLEAIAASGKVPHAIMLHEEDGGGAMPLALSFVSRLNSQAGKQNETLTYPDTLFTFPLTTSTKVSGKVSELVCDDFLPLWRELVLSNPWFTESDFSSAMGMDRKSGLITVAQGRALLKKLSLSTVSDGWRSIIVYLPEKMNVQTSNMLLKSLEEPSSKTVFILITHSPEDVLITISSRCLRLRVPPLSQEALQGILESGFSFSAAKAASVAALAAGSLGKALALGRESEVPAVSAQLFASLMDSILSRQLENTLAVGESLAELESRDRQKAFCAYASDCLRNIFLLQQGLDSLAAIPSDKMEFFRDAAGKAAPAFCRRGTEILSRASRMIERNVAQKIVFCNMVTRLYFAAG